MYRTYSITTFVICFFYCVPINAQYNFSGEVSRDFIDATAYLTSIDDYKKSSVFLSEKIIQESKINSAGKFEFKGDFLPTDNKLYKIYIDKCNSSITDSEHLLNECEDSNYIIFIANNQDTIYFPLNSFLQMFCDFEYSRNQNIAVYKIDSIQENLLSNLQDSKSDAQRKLIYSNYFKEIQKFGKSLNEPLVELYTYSLYSDEKSFSRHLYLEDLKNSEYYNNLLERLDVNYPNSSYTIQYKNDLIKDQYPLLKSKNKTNYLTYLLGLILFISLIMNYLLYKKQFSKNQAINYKEVLSPQEQKVFELMNEKLSNKEIADKLFISLSTVKTHINNIYSKLSISSRKEIGNYF